jgi:HK97 family phage major capsid protein
MKKNSVELRDAIHQLVLECRSMVDVCKNEKRNMTEDEEKKFNELKEEVEEKKRELKELEEELKNYDDELPEDLEEPKKEEKSDEEEKEENKEEKNKRYNAMKNTLIQEIRNAGNGDSFKINAETRTVSVGGYTVGDGASAVTVPGAHDHVIETEIQGILEPLYAKSALTALGVKWYTGLPQGDIQVPIMGKGSVTWEDELAEAGESTPTFSSKKLQPKRLTAYVDISNKLIRQDTVGAENAIRADIVKGIQDKLEATIFGNGAVSTTQPAGIFNGATIAKNDTFAKVCNAEASVEAANVYGEMKYLMAPTTKAFYRSLIKGTNATGMVFENNEMDGVPAVVTSNVAANNYVYGDFSNLAVGSWGDIEITVDTVTQARKDCTRLVVNAYFDAIILRPEAFAYGKTQA